MIKLPGASNQPQVYHWLFFCSEIRSHGKCNCLSSPLPYVLGGYETAISEYVAQIPVLGAANSGYAKTVLEACKNSNQITFEMNTRMELAKAGLYAVACQELAKTLNDEFGKGLPMA